MAEFFGADDIDFELAEFNRRFFVKSPHRRWAFVLLHPRAMEFLLSQPDYWLESNERQFIIWRKQLLTPAEIGEAANLVVNLLSMVPDFARTPNYVAVPSQGNAAR
jgi:hypothetical protein